MGQGHVVPVRELVGHRDPVDLWADCEDGGTGNSWAKRLTTQPLEIVMRWIGCLLSRTFLSEIVGQHHPVQDMQSAERTVVVDQEVAYGVQVSGGMLPVRRESTHRCCSWQRCR